MICEKNQCTGCGLCVNVCPAKYITLQTDEYGALKYSIDEQKCISCGKCERMCPSKNDITFNKVINCYAGWAIDSRERSSSSSGGIAALLYRKTLADGGAIVGACFENGNFHLKLSDSLQDIDLFKGSKYVNCNGQDIYLKVKERIENKQPVLFVGTPCQVAAIKQYIGASKLLYTVDLICHGTPPQKHFIEHFKPIENRITYVNFRDRGVYRLKMKDALHNIKTYDGGSDEYYLSFINGIIFNDCCYQCKYAKIERVSDITIGDFWGIDEKFLQQENVDKVSLVLSNTQQGEQLLQSISGLRLSARNLDEALPKNEQLKKPFKRSADRVKFERYYPKHGFNKTIHKLAIEKTRRKNIIMTKLSNLLHKIRR